MTNQPTRPGAAPERTTLAWRRTGLALLVASLTIARLTLDAVGPVLAVPAAATAVLALWVVLEARRARHGVTLLDGRLPGVVAVAVAALATAEVVSALAHLV